MIKQMKVLHMYKKVIHGLYNKKLLNKNSGDKFEQM